LILAAVDGKRRYLLVHDDTFVFPLSVLCELRPNNFKVPWYVGSTHCTGPNFRCQHRNIKFDGDGNKPEANFGGWINGGAGVVLSQKAVQNLDLQQCIRYYNQVRTLSCPAPQTHLRHSAS